MATAVFYRPNDVAARVLGALGLVPPLRVLLGVRAFGLDLLLSAGPARVELRSTAAIRTIFEYVLPDLPLHAVRPALESNDSEDPTARAIWSLVCASSGKVPSFLALADDDDIDVGQLLGACARDNLPRVDA